MLSSSVGRYGMDSLSLSELRKLTLLGCININVTMETNVIVHANITMHLCFHNQSQGNVSYIVVIAKYQVAFLHNLVRKSHISNCAK